MTLATRPLSKKKTVTPVMKERAHWQKELNSYSRTQKEKAITQPRIEAQATANRIFMVSRTTKSDHPHCSFASKVSKEDDEPTFEVLGVA